MSNNRSLKKNTLFSYLGFDPTSVFQQFFAGGGGGFLGGGGPGRGAEGSFVHLTLYVFLLCA